MWGTAGVGIEADSNNWRNSIYAANYISVHTKAPAYQTDTDPNFV